ISGQQLWRHLLGTLEGAFYLSKKVKLASWNQQPRRLRTKPFLRVNGMPKFSSFLPAIKASRARTNQVQTRIYRHQWRGDAVRRKRSVLNSACFLGASSFCAFCAPNSRGLRSSGALAKLLTAGINA